MKQRGFSLLEVMLVIVLMGSVATLVIGTFPSTDERVQNKRMEKLRNALVFASEMTMYDEQIHGLMLQDNKWILMVLHKSQMANKSVLWPGYEWKEVKYGRYSFNDTLPAPFQFKLLIDNAEKTLSEDYIVEPQIIFSPGGEVTNYRIELLNNETRKRSVISTRVGSTDELSRYDAS